MSRNTRLIIAIIICVILNIQGLYFATKRNDVDSILQLSIPTVIGTSIPYIIGIFILYWILGIQRKPYKFSINKFFAKKTQSSTINDWAYEQAAIEIEKDRQDKAVWGRAIAESKGSESEARSAYIRIRVERLIAEKFLSEPIPVFEENEGTNKSRVISKRVWIAFAILSTVIIIVFSIILISNSNRQSNEENKPWLDYQKKETTKGIVDLKEQNTNTNEENKPWLAYQKKKTSKGIDDLKEKNTNTLDDKQINKSGDFNNKILSPGEWLSDKYRNKTYCGLSIGMNNQDVRNILSTSNNNYDKLKDNQFTKGKQIFFEKKHLLFSILFSPKTELLSVISCSNNCEPIHNININSSEKDIIDNYGTPSWVSNNKPDDLKILTYHGKFIQTQFDLKNDMVKAIRIMDSSEYFDFNNVVN